MPLNKFGENILLTNFSDYVENFSDRFKTDVLGEKANAGLHNSNESYHNKFWYRFSKQLATIIDLLTACKPSGVFVPR